AFGRGTGHVLAPHRLGVAAGELDDPCRPPRVGRLPGQAPEAATRREPLPAAPPAARAWRTVGVDDHVTHLAGEAVGAPAQSPVRDDARADAGAERHDDDVVASLPCPRLALGPGRAGGVVVNEYRHVEPGLEGRPQ